MKNAYLIMAHHRPDLLHELIEALDDPRNDIYIHIDIKAKDLNWNIVAEKAKVVRISAISVNWGGYTQVDCEYRLLKAALQDGHHDYYHLMTGVTYPIKSQDYINAYLEEHNGTEYVGFDNKRDYSFRAKYKHLFCEEGKMPGLQGKIKFKLRDYYLKLQCALGIDHFKKYNMVCKKGCAYWSITEVFAKYVVGKEPLIHEMLANSISGDEVFVQTLLYNSEFRNNAKDLNDEYNGCMREFAWEHITKSNDPWHNFHLTDKNYLLDSDKWFALKFESNDGMELVQELKRNLKK